MDTIFEGVAPGFIEMPAENIARFIQLYLMAGLMRGERGLHAGDAAADDCDLFRNRGFGNVIHKLAHGGRICGAQRDTVIEVGFNAVCASHAGADILQLSAGDLLRIERVNQ